MSQVLPSADALPDALLDYSQWVCWREQLRDGKQTKVPLDPVAGEFASTTDSETWVSFDVARHYAEAGNATGIGFVFTADDPFVGIDIDDCRDPDSEQPSETATTIIRTLDSYTEVSPSGTGYHVLVRGALPDGRNRHENVEMYDRARFFTMTGDHVPETPPTIEARPDALSMVHGEYVAQQSSGEQGDARGPTATNKQRDSGHNAQSGPGAADREAAAGQTDDELLERAKNASNGEKFKRLWRGGTAGYESHSEADMALCALLAFWTGGDHERVDRLFRRSGLMRAKWDETHFADGSTYGEKTVERAIAGIDEYYDPANRNDEVVPRGSMSDDAITEATLQSLHEEIETLKEREAHHLDVIERLHDRVEELQAENERLRDELAAERENPRQGEGTGGDETSRWSQLRDVFRYNAE